LVLLRSYYRDKEVGVFCGPSSAPLIKRAKMVFQNPDLLTRAQVVNEAIKPTFLPGVSIGQIRP
jgi:hypothetical protein